MNEQTPTLEARPAHKMAVPLFLLSSIPYFGILAYDYYFKLNFDKTFVWFGGFYLMLGLSYFIVRLLKRQ